MHESLICYFEFILSWDISMIHFNAFVSFCMPILILLFSLILKSLFLDKKEFYYDEKSEY